MSKPFFLAILCSILFASASRAQQVIQLTTRTKMPGSDTVREQTITDAASGKRTVYNVGTPSLTIYKPQGVKANGIGVLICPDGAFHILDIDNEGVTFARILAAKGYTAAVLKYRLVPLNPKDPFGSMSSYASDFAALEKVMMTDVPFAIEDGKTAMQYLQDNAGRLGLHPGKIGVVGFSAGGTLAAAIAFDSSASVLPLFSAPVYPYLSPVINDSVPAHACPLFMAVAENDDFSFDSHCLTLYQKWKAAGALAELHIYTKGKHGFGTKKQGLPVDGWIARFTDWLTEMKFD